jgi:hypothetical protein
VTTRIRRRHAEAIAIEPPAEPVAEAPVVAMPAATEYAPAVEAVTPTTDIPPIETPRLTAGHAQTHRPHTSRARREKSKQLSLF